MVLDLSLVKRSRIFGQLTKSKHFDLGLIAYPIWLIMSGFKLIKKSWVSVYIDYGMQLYSTWVGEHYSPTGRGYYNYGNLSKQEKLNLYGEPRGRIEYFLKNYQQTLKYEDGQSILDAGCGRGQTSKFYQNISRLQK